MRETTTPGTAPSLGFLEWGVAEYRAPDAERSGYRFIVTPAPGGALVGVIDGLGSGPEADQAAEMAAEVLEARAGDPIWWLLQRCHVQLRETRGATMTLAQIRSEDGTLTWGGIGNVEGSLVRASLTKRRREATRRLPGAVGFILPQFQPAATRLAPGDVVVLATNGIAPRFADDVSLLGDPTAIAQRILRRHRRHDEALVLAVRFLGT